MGQVVTIEELQEAWRLRIMGINTPFDSPLYTHGIRAWSQVVSRLPGGGSHDRKLQWMMSPLPAPRGATHLSLDCLVRGTIYLQYFYPTDEEIDREVQRLCGPKG